MLPLATLMMNIEEARVDVVAVFVCSLVCVFMPCLGSECVVHMSCVCRCLYTVSSNVLT